MKNLRDILYKTGIIKVIGPTHIAISSICFDSREVESKSLFIAIKGTQSDGHHYIEKAIENGAVAIVCEYLPVKPDPSITFIKVQNSSKSLGIIASNYFDNPSAKIILVGVTGTNGKTTIVTLLHELFQSLGYKAGLLSTIGNKINSVKIPATHTTPDAIQINRFLKKMLDKNCSHCFMEVSSHAIAQNRISGLSFKGGIFTNVTHDHLDYHKTFHEYLNTKKSFFDHLSPESFALSNIDDKNGPIMLQNTKAKKYTYSLQRMADFKAKILENQLSGLNIQIEGIEIWCKQVGVFNAYNLLAVYAAACLVGEDKTEILTMLSNLNIVEGRFENLKSKDHIIAIVDYAHTPDALKNVLQNINTIRTKNEQLITVIGAGGDRDKHKRPLMAEIACNESDKVILTSDNPRSEEPEKIIEEMKKGIDLAQSRKVMVIIDRKEAIKTSCAIARAGDIILVAGKGHEKYQEVKGTKYPFDDKAILKEFLHIK
ncbi:UDP-N-acetylmuramoyl-L-alanyl-D-glutamate--2,6-diaminopimelate ligase [Bacteroidota bacterium]